MMAGKIKNILLTFILLSGGISASYGQEQEEFIHMTFSEVNPLPLDAENRQVVEFPFTRYTYVIHLSAEGHPDTDSIRYSWIMDKVHTQWSPLSTKGMIILTNLNPGNYKLHIQSYAPHSDQLLSEREMELRILPPFIGTIWAKLLFILLLLLAGWAILRYFWMKREKELAAEKVEFYLNTAHDIRTPLTLIKVPLEELTKEEGLSEKGRQYLRIALNKAADLHELISNALAYEQSAHGYNDLHLEKCDLTPLVEARVERFKFNAEAKQQTLTFTPGEKLPEVWVDKEKINSILLNLLSNAIKYTPEGGKIQVQTFVENDHWGIRIEDNGIGIPEKEQKNIYNLFFRGSNVTQTPSSNGIGLYMVQRLVKIHKGSIHFESHKNQGTTFTLLFPMGYKYYKQDLIEFSENSREQLQTIQQNIKEATEENPSTAAESNRRYHLVVVEDNTDMRHFLESLLSDTYTVSTAENGLKGLELIRKENPDLVISDIMMPGMSGEKLCRQLKQEIETSHIPIILLTALSETEHTVYGLNHLADSYLHKPFNSDILLATISTLIRNRQILKEKFAKLNWGDEMGELPDNASGLDIEFIHKVKELIEGHLQDPHFNIDQLASLLNMSRSGFFKKLKNLTDQAPNTLIRNVRLNKAAQLLPTHHYTIQEVSDLTGFSDVKYFRKLFKAHYGCTPGEYIEQKKSGASIQNPK